MWKLELYRVINSVSGWMAGGEYDTCERALEAIMGAGYALDYRIIAPNGLTHPVEWLDFIDDEDGCEYCLPILGKV